MRDSWETSLPDYFLNDDENLAKTRRAVTQWSRTVAYLWSSVLAFGKDQDKVRQERTLKKFIVEMLHKQCQRTFAYESYGTSKDEANLWSEYFKYILLGENCKIPVLNEDEDNIVTLTLSEVLYELSGEECIFTRYPEFTKMFTFRVVPEFTGKIIQVKDENDEPVDKQFISLMAFPPRPVFSEVTVTQQQLYDWVNNINTGGDYLPSSSFIPIAGT